MKPAGRIRARVEGVRDIAAVSGQSNTGGGEGGDLQHQLEGKRGRPGLRLLLLFFATVLINEQADLEHSQLFFKILEWGWCTQGLDNLLAGLC